MSGTLLALLALGFPGAEAAETTLLAQAQRFLLGPGSSVGPSTKVKPENCVTAEDGSVTCDTKLENSPSDTPARPQLDPFGN
jgi:hypothetical protein